MEQEINELALQRIRDKILKFKENHPLLKIKVGKKDNISYLSPKETKKLLNDLLKEVDETIGMLK